jgi:hypothetical protein
LEQPQVNRKQETAGGGESVAKGTVKRLEHKGSGLLLRNVKLLLDKQNEGNNSLVERMIAQFSTLNLE